jgi:rod shape-determining protein MreD
LTRKQLIAVGKVALLFVVAVILQTVLVSRISVLGVTADLFLIFTVVIGMSRGSMDGAIFGFLAGVAADIAFMQPLGIRSLVYVLVGYLVGMVVVRFGTVGPWAVFLVALGASFSEQLLYSLVQFVMGPRAGFFTILGSQILPEAILDALVAIPVYVLLIRLRVIPVPRTVEPAIGKGGSE